MKNVMLVFLMMVGCHLVPAQMLTMKTDQPQVITEPDNPIFSWIATVYDFGDIKIGVPVEHAFTFTNTGKDPLIISSVKASCGCTVASYTKDPIPAGENGVVKARFNAAKAGTFTKTITVLANTQDGSVLLTIKGTVVK